MAVAIDDPSVNHSGFTYSWSGGTQQSATSTASTYAAKFTKGNHTLTCTVTGNDTAVNGVCSMSGSKSIISKSYKLNYVSDSHTIISPIVSDPITATGYAGSSCTDSSISVTTITLEGSLPINTDHITPVLTMEATLVWDVVEDQQHVLGSQLRPCTAVGSYQPDVDENDRDTTITMEVIDKVTSQFEYIQASVLTADTGPNNVGGAGSVLSTETNP